MQMGVVLVIELYNQNTTDFTYHGVILHECTKAVVKEALNGDFVAKLENRSTTHDF